MKKLLTPFLLLAVCFANAQLLSWTPSFIQETSMPVTITANAAYGNQGLKGHNPFDVFIHIGVITNLSKSSADWKYVRGVWPSKFTWEQATPGSNNQWTYKIDSTTSLRSYFGITNANEHITALALLFRSGDGTLKLANTDGSDMYIPVYTSTENVRIDVPLMQPLYTPAPIAVTRKIGDNVPIVAHASITGSSMNVYFNGTLISSTTGTTDSTAATITASGTQTIIATATSGGVTSSDTVSFFVAPSNNVAALPTGVSDGINYEPGDTSVTLVLYAPNKKNIVVVGDFSDWVPSSNYLMNVTPDGNRFWLRITGLTKGTEYAYQYLIDGTLQVSDYNSEKILDKYVDPLIPATSYPNLKAFPSKAAGSLVSVLQTGQTPYTWQVPKFTRPDQKNLIIYELLVRDFVAAQNWQTLTDTLTYLKRLGVNAIEVMPFCNFEGFSSWGYNSNFFLAPDKVYGTSTALKQFVDACHAQGIAVIMDLAMADVSGSSPLATMYWNSTNNTPATNNPWLNVTSTNGYTVGSQFNHTSQATIDLRNRVYKRWLIDYNLDGFRFDLAGAYTQATLGDSYDQSRVNTWNNIYASVQSISPGSYCILESFTADNSTYVNSGMLVWGAGNLNSSVTQATMGFNSNWDFVSQGLYTNQGCNQAGLVDYQESHDETLTGDRRVMFKNEQYGNSSGSYNIKDIPTGLKRAAMAASFWALMPGPKMMWMFEELGYDYSPNECTNGLTATCSNLDPKPLPWGNMYPDANRQALYTVYSKLFKVRNAYPSTFYNANSTTYNTSGAVKFMSVYSSAFQVVVYGNFDVVQQTGSVSFPSTGTWYNLFTGASINVTTTSYQNVTLSPGEYYVYVNQTNVLPVSWVDFTGRYENGGTVALNWSTTNEMSNDHYDIERSSDGKNFTHIGSVTAQRGVSGKGDYNFTDVTAPAGKIYYRIKQLDVTGKYSFSKVIYVETDVKTSFCRTFYTGSGVKLIAQIDMNKVNVTLRDASGKLLTQQTINNVSNGQSFEIPTSTYAKGLYLVTVSSEKCNRTDKVVIR